MGKRQYSEEKARIPSFWTNLFRKSRPDLRSVLEQNAEVHAVGGLEEHEVSGGDVDAELLLARLELLVGQVAEALRGHFADADHEGDLERHRVGEDLLVKLERTRSQLEHVPEDRDMLAVARNRGEGIERGDHGI